MAYTDEQFAQAANNWDLETLYTDLASAKGKRLTPVEKLHLRGLLYGYSPAEIAARLNKNVKGVEVDLCNTLYKYVKSLIDKGDEKVENWRNITEWLEEAGYKTHLSNQVQLSDESLVELLVKKANISFDNNKIIVDLNLRIVAASPTDAPIIEDFNTNGKG
ncbi:helix-turn-helix transcriptional regulator [Iningainema tapete]|uniref:Helix-turn-helix domain-containing protein n=1 Tax=Iningainema tapete BLCC-T55 TaxID=2748662 RepID=A0A8J6XTN8_9CYAN|nr:helix-turn-helix domain-containing protein [Iningainema tapete]MBD2778060.1 helix-turn-helix domain-containing protein [Iningainema tapete BLCC-T55]